MESIKKIYAIILDRNQGGLGEGGNCKVVAFIRDKDFINDEENIKKNFQTDCKIFSSKLFSGINNLSVNDLIEIIPLSFNTEVDDGNNYYVKHKPVKKTGNLIIDVPNEYLMANYINLNELNIYFESRGYFKNELGSFYLCDNEKLYGPFKINNGKIQPKKDTFVNSFQYDINELIEFEIPDFSYLIEEPKNKIDVVDCMTVSQLMDFLKNTLTIDRVDINLIKKTYESISSINAGQTNLDKIRLERASLHLSQLILSYEELKKISSNTNEWNVLVNKIIKEHKKQFEEETLNEIELNIQKKEDHKNQLQTEIKLKHNELNKLTFDCSKIKKEIEDINSKKDDLILSIKIAAGINNNIEGVKNDLSKQFYEVISSNIASSITDLDEFYDQFDINITSKTLFKNALYILKEKKFLIGNSIALILNTIQHLGNFKIMIQNAEADWLKYSYLQQNGFNLIYQNAIENPETLHFFVLQDFNIASFECYGKPIIDISNGIRNKIPGTQNIWPNNLFFILIAVDSNIDNFGFPINKSTFRNWCFLPYIEDYIYQKIQVEEGISLKDLEVFNQYPDYSANYF
jgi:hypothetical protein